MYRGVTRDENENWLWGFAGRCGAEVDTPLQAELMALYVGMKDIYLRKRFDKSSHRNRFVAGGKPRSLLS